MSTKDCPYCGEQVHIPSIGRQVRCRNCGRTYSKVKMLSDHPNKNCARCGVPYWIPFAHPHMPSLPGQSPNRDDYCDECYHIVWKEWAEEEARQYREVKKKCVSCNGKGKIKGYTCVSCRGKGYYWTRERI